MHVAVACAGNSARCATRIRACSSLHPALLIDCSTAAAEQARLVDDSAVAESPAWPPGALVHWPSRRRVQRTPRRRPCREAVPALAHTATHPACSSLTLRGALCSTRSGCMHGAHVPPSVELLPVCRCVCHSTFMCRGHTPADAPGPCMLAPGPLWTVMHHTVCPSERNRACTGCPADRPTSWPSRVSSHWLPC